MSRALAIALLVICSLGCRSGDRPQPPPGQPQAAAPKAGPAEEQAAAPKTTPAATDTTPAPAAPAPADTAPHLETSSLAFFTSLKGQLPADVDLWRTIPTAKRLHRLLGPQLYELFLIQMQESTPIQADKGIYYVEGHKKYGGPTDVAMFAVDPARDALYVWMMAGARPEELREPNWRAPVPKAIRAAIAKVPAKP